MSEPQVGLNFAALDVETANGARGSICSFGVVIVRGGKITEKHHLLTVPPGSLNAFAAFNTALHGISHASLVNAPSFASRMAQVLTLVGDLPVVAHNAQFDLGAISDACEEANIDAPQWVYGCTLAMSRKAGLGLKSYSLPVVCAALGVEQGEHHRADDDAQAAANIVLALAGQLNSRSLHSLAAALTVRMAFTRDVEWTPGSQVAARWAAAAPVVPEANVNANPAHPLYGQHVVFTGVLSVDRAQAYDWLAAVGGCAKNGVTRKTKFLVIGDGFTGMAGETFSTGKAAKAFELNREGRAITILTEQQFLHLLADVLPEALRSNSTVTDVILAVVEPAGQVMAGVPGAASSFVAVVAQVTQEVLPEGSERTKKRFRVPALTPKFTGPCVVEPALPTPGPSVEPEDGQGKWAVRFRAANAPVAVVAEVVEALREAAPTEPPGRRRKPAGRSALRRR